MEPFKKLRTLALMVTMAQFSVQLYTFLGAQLSQESLNTAAVNTVVAAAHVGVVVNMHPHSFRIYSSPFYVQPRPLDLWNNFVADYWPDAAFKAHFRLTRASFKALVSALGPSLASKPTNARPEPLSAERKAAMGLYKLAHGVSYGTIELMFGVAQGTACKAYRQFVSLVVGKLSSLVSFPSHERLKEIMHDFSDRGMPGCVGSIDGTHVAVKKPSMPFYEDYFCVRKDDFTLNTQAVCDYNGYFYDVCTGWPGSVHDGRILANSPLAERADELFSGAGGVREVAGTHLVKPYLVGDSGFPCLPWLQTPLDSNASPHMQHFNRVSICSKEKA